MAALCAAFHSHGATEEEREELQRASTSIFSGSVGWQFASGYLASSGTICDTCPVTSQEFDWKFDFGDFGFIDGYAWTVSSLHNKQHESHRPEFNEFEGALRYGYRFAFAEKVTLDTRIGPLWNPPIGYDHAHQNYWGPYVLQSLNNPYVVPYWSGLWLLAPKMRGRVRIGLRKPMVLCEGLVLTPSAETVWMDRRRFYARYGDDPEKDHIFGGAFATTTVGVRLSWVCWKGLTLYTSIQQFDIINSQARRAVKRSHAYYAKCDWPFLKVGVEYDF